MVEQWQRRPRPLPSPSALTACPLVPESRWVSVSGYVGFGQSTQLQSLPVIRNGSKCREHFANLATVSPTGDVSRLSGNESSGLDPPLFLQPSQRLQQLQFMTVHVVLCTLSSTSSQVPDAPWLGSERGLGIHRLSYSPASATPLGGSNTCGELRWGGRVYAGPHVPTLQTLGCTCWTLAPFNHAPPFLWRFVSWVGSSRQRFRCQPSCALPRDHGFAGGLGH